MRISRTTVILLVANLIAFGFVWRATTGHRPAAVPGGEAPAGGAPGVLRAGPRNDP